MLRCGVLELALLTSPLAAQTGAEARTSVRLFGGTALNQPLLWSIPRQPILVPGTQAAPQYDTLALARSLAPGLTVGVAFTHFPTSHLGLAGRLAYLGLERASGCSGVYYNGVQRDNEGLCASIQGQRRTQGLMMLDLQGIARMMPRSAVSPSLHAGLTAATYTASTVYVEGVYPNGIRIVVDDPTPGSVVTGATLGLTLTTALGSGYQLAFDLSDTWLGFPVVAGPANATAHAPTTTRYTRHTVFSLGLDFVLDAKRGRRY
jgi:hypothetical protein